MPKQKIIEEFNKWYDSYDTRPPRSSILGFIVRTKTLSYNEGCKDTEKRIEGLIADETSLARKFVAEKMVEFDKKFEGIYYGKDAAGFPDYPPKGYVDDVKEFLQTAIEQQQTSRLTSLFNRISKN